MIDVLSAFAALKVTAANLFRKKVTEPLPWEGGRSRPERYRTSFALVHNEDGDEACIGCRMCERICPSQIITVISGGKQQAPVSGKMRGVAKDFTLDLNACIHCELCVQVCPEDAILMLRVPSTPGYAREDLFLTMAKLYENEPVTKSWGTGALLVGMQEAGQPKPERKAPPPKAEGAAPKAEGAAPKPPAAETTAGPKAEPTPPAPEAPVSPTDAPPPPRALLAAVAPALDTPASAAPATEDATVVAPTAPPPKPSGAGGE